MPDETEIVISREPGAALATFPHIGCTAGQLVFWLNKDSSGQPHRPLFPNGLTPRSQTGAGDTSDNLQPANGVVNFAPPAQGASVTATYKCQLHEGETGLIDIYPDFFSNPNQVPNAQQGVAYTPAPLTVGGKPPFTISLSDVALPPGMSVIADPVQGPTLTGTPSEAGTEFAFTMHSEDALGNAVDQTYLLTVSA